MFSLQRALGEDSKILELLESCATEASRSIAALNILLRNRNDPASLITFRATRKREKELLGSVEETLLHALVLALEREDVQALADRLYRIPKTIDNFAHRYIISA